MRPRAWQAAWLLRLATHVWQAAWVGQEASLRQCGCRTLPKRSNQHKCHCHHWEGPRALARLHDLQRGTGTPWALVWLVLWGSVKPGPQFSETERGVQAWRHPVGSGGRIIPSPLPCPKSSPRIPLPLRTGLWEGGGDTDPVPALAGVHFPLQLGWEGREGTICYKVGSKPLGLWAGGRGGRSQGPKAARWPLPPASCGWWCIPRSLS